MKPLIAGLLGCVLLSCGGSTGGPSDAGDDDAGVVDAGTVDAGIVDAGVGDAGADDAGVVDAGIDSGTLDAGCPYAYCEDFEGYDAGAIVTGRVLGPWVATFQGARTEMTIDPASGFGGSQALRVVIHYVDPDGGSVRATLNQHTADGGALVGSSLFGRAEIFYAPTGDDAGLPLAVHSWIFNAAGLTRDGGATSMNMGGGGVKAQLNYQYPPEPKLPDGGVEKMPDGGTYPTEDSAQGGALTTGVWHCMQWQYSGAPENIGRVWIDGTPAITVNDPTPVKNWQLSDAYRSIDFGFTHYQQLPNGIDLTLDNFALDSQMIPCP